MCGVDGVYDWAVVAAADAVSAVLLIRSTHGIVEAGTVVSGIEWSVGMSW